MSATYCDLSIDGEPLWQGVLCMNCVLLDTYPYLGFIGHLAFDDAQGGTDPVYTGFGPGGRYSLLYAQIGQPTLQIALQAVPAQQLDVTLGGQNCTLAIYTK
jgi:hypothetical protein